MSRFAARSYAPSDEQNPWKLDTFMTAEEWKEVSRWYGYSLRSLMFDGRWDEYARCPSRASAYHLLRALAAQHPHDLFIIVHCTLMGVRRWSTVILAVNKPSCKSGRHDERTGDNLMSPLLPLERGW